MNDQAFYDELARKLTAQGIEPGAGPVSVNRLEGCVMYRLLDANGNLKQEGMFKNLVNSCGDRWVAHLLAGSTVGDPRSMWAELGVNTTAPVKGGTGLGTLINASSLAVSAAYPTRVDSFGTGPGEWTVWRFSWGAGVTTNGSIGEVGMRTQAGSFVAHAQVAPNVNKTANDTLQIDWGWRTLGS